MVKPIKQKARSKKRARITHSDLGNPLASVTPDSLSRKPTNYDTLGREEQTKDTVVISKITSIKLIINDKIVYSKNDNHSAEEGQ